MEPTKLITSITITIIILTKPVATCNHCPKFTYKKHSDPNFLSLLPGSTKLSDLALLGSHSSASYNPNLGTKWQTQDLTIPQQLHHNVRLLDIGLHARSDVFEIFHHNKAISVGFHEVVVHAIEFLEDYPQELIVLMLHQALPPASDVSKSNCEILEFYIKFFIRKEESIVKNWKLNDTIGQFRGKILLASLDSSFIDDGCAFDARQCNPDLDFLVNSNHVDVDDKFAVKWNEISGRTVFSYYVESGSCLINDLSFYDGSNGRSAVARDGGHYNGDICAQPINYLVAEIFKKPPGVMVIVLADFVTRDLSDKIKESNVH